MSLNCKLIILPSEYAWCSWKSTSECLSCVLIITVEHKLMSYRHKTKLLLLSLFCFEIIAKGAQGLLWALCQGSLLVSLEDYTWCQGKKLGQLDAKEAFYSLYYHSGLPTPSLWSCSPDNVNEIVLLNFSCSIASKAPLSYSVISMLLVGQWAPCTEFTTEIGHLDGFRHRNKQGFWPASLQILGILKGNTPQNCGNECLREPGVSSPSPLSFHSSCYVINKY